jgi:hypothetical protein
MLAVSISFYLTIVTEDAVKAWGFTQPWILDQEGPDAHLWLQMLYCGFVSLSLVIWSFRVLPPVIAKCNLYMYLVELFSISVQALQFYYRGSPLCVPDGPYFDNRYWLTITPILESFVSLAGVGVFETFMKGWGARQAFWVTTFVKCFASLVDNFIILRYNQAIGIPDSLTYFIGGATIVALVETLDFLPSNVIIGKLCPKSIESTVYAILAGFSNMGSNVAVIEGKVFQAFLKVRMQEPRLVDADCMDEFRQTLWPGEPLTRDASLLGLDKAQIEEYLLGGDAPRCAYQAGYEFPGCNIENLSLLVFCSQFIGPLLSIPLTFVLIPDVKLDGDFLNAEDDKNTELSAAARDVSANFVDNNELPSGAIKKSTSTVLDSIAQVAAQGAPEGASVMERLGRALSSASMSAGGGAKQAYML